MGIENVEVELHHSIFDIHYYISRLFNSVPPCEKCIDIPMHHYLFSYGTLQFPAVQMQLFGRLLEGDMDILMGYEKVPIEITDESFIATGANKQQQIAIAGTSDNGILGMAFILTEEELLKADKYEPVGYKRILVTLQSGIQAWIYVQG